MFNLKAYKEWKELFDENVSNVWQEESIPVLKKLSMMLFSVKKEIKKIEDEVERDVLNLRKNVVEIQKKHDFLPDIQSMGSSNNNKENVLLKIAETKFTQSKNMSKNITVDSPEMFQNMEVPLSGSNNSGSIIISDDDIASTLTNGSPEIKKKRRNRAFQKHSQRGQRLRDSNTPTMSFLGNFRSQQKGDSSSKKNGGNVEQLTGLNDKSSMDFFKGLIVHSQRPDGSVNKDVILPNKNDNSDVKNKNEEVVLTPTRTDCEIDLSVVQCTPISVSLPKRKEKMLSHLSKKKCRGGKGTTLTQMFSRNEGRKNSEKNSRLQETNYDSDDTYFNPSHGGKSSQTSSVMGITRMVSYLNTDSPLKEKGKAKTEEEVSGVINLDPDTQEIASMVEDIRYEDFEDDTSLNSAIVEENESEETDDPQSLNEFLAQAQNVPKYQLEAAPVVRGKARKNLPGWACKDCEKFYLKQGLNPNELLALNKCSKHRGYYRPREDTLPGYWDMNMVTQETENKN